MLPAVAGGGVNAPWAFAGGGTKAIIVASLVTGASGAGGGGGGGTNAPPAAAPGWSAKTCPQFGQNRSFGVALVPQLVHVRSSTTILLANK